MQLTGIQYDVECLPEDIPIRGNLSTSGNDVVDRRFEDETIAELQHNCWAWCTVKVTVSWNELEGTTYLGGCSYADEEAFRRDCLESLKDEARAELERKVRKTQLTEGELND